MSNNINRLQDRLDGIAEDIRADAELILKQMDIDDLCADPEEYVREMAVAFIEQHEEEIGLGVAIGRRFASNILKEMKIGNKD